jgi:hypothetical protein
MRSRIGLGDGWGSVKIMKTDRSLTVSESLERMRAQGFADEFVVAGGKLSSRRDAGAWGPHGAKILDKQRVEGQSDPDDMAIVYGIETADGRRGTLVDAFGLYGDPEISAVVREMEDCTMPQENGVAGCGSASTQRE